MTQSLTIIGGDKQTYVESMISLTLKHQLASQALHTSLLELKYKEYDISKECLYYTFSECVHNTSFLQILTKLFFLWFCLLCKGRRKHCSQFGVNGEINLTFPPLLDDMMYVPCSSTHPFRQLEIVLVWALIRVALCPILNFNTNQNLSMIFTKKLKQIWMMDEPKKHKSEWQKNDSSIWKKINKTKLKHNPNK